MTIIAAIIGSILALLAIRGVVRSLEPAAQAWLAAEERRVAGTDVLSRGLLPLARAERTGTAPVRAQALATR